MRLFAGTGRKGKKDGPGGEAEFSTPTGLAAGKNGALLVADAGSGSGGDMPSLSICALANKRPPRAGDGNGSGGDTPSWSNDPRSS